MIFVFCLLWFSQEYVMPRWPTPEYYHCLEKEVRQLVYEPEADSFLFLEGLEKDGDRILAAATASDALRVVEIGCGSGIVISFLATILSFDARHQFHVVDINPHALAAASKTFEQTRNAVASSSSASLHASLGDLFLPFEDTSQPFDVILFNPPYVPTSMEELDKAISGEDHITAAWCGGTKGRVVVDRFIAMLPKHLSRNNGVCYIIAIKENDVSDMEDRIRATFAGEEVQVDVVVQRFTGEFLCLLRVVRTFQRRVTE